MPLSPEERAAINRENSRQSCGPKCTSVVRGNALKHGLRAAPGALPNEDPTVAPERSEAWNAFYRPQSPEAQHLLNACVDATLLFDRVARQNTALVSEQVFDADLTWQNDRADEVQNHAARLKADPAAARRGLEQTADGCRWLALRWQHLADALERDGRWTRLHRAEILRLLGCRPGRDLKADPQAWEFWVLATLTSPSARDAELARAFADDRMPGELRPFYALDKLPRYDWVLKRLGQLLDGHLAALRAETDHLHETVDLPARAAAAERAMVLDGARGRLFLRYHAEARTAFQRASKALHAALERDREALLEGSEGALELAAELSPNKPNSEPAAEPDRPEESAQVVMEQPVAEISAEPPAAAEFAEVAPQFAEVAPQFAPVEADDEGAALDYWTRATGATSPQTDVFPFSGLSLDLEPGPEVVPDAPFACAGRMSVASVRST